MAISSASVLSILRTYFLLLYVHSSVSQIEAELCPVEVREHFLTQRPQTYVTAQAPCTPFDQGAGESFLQCDGEFNGNYQWEQENQQTNYVLFNLSQITLLSKISFTYTVESGTQEPKISFCAVPASMSIGSAFGNLECQEVRIEATGDTVVGTLVPSFANKTGKIGMEVITQGIKAAFTATRVEFFGSCTVSTTAATLPPQGTERSSSAAPVTANEQVNTETGDKLSVSGDAILSGKTRMTNTLLITVMCLILSRKLT